MSLESFLDGFDDRDWREADADAGPVRIAFVGAGWWTQNFAVPATRASELATPAVIVSSSTAKAERVADEQDMPVGITYAEYDDGAAVDAYDAVYVCTPNATHLEHVETAARLGKPVLCEKPMEASVERAERLVDAAETADITLMIAYRMHTEPSIRRMRELIRDGAIGTPAHVHAHMIQPLLDIIPDPDQWRLDPTLAGEGSSVTDLGIYSINTTRFAIDRDPVAVVAMMDSFDEPFAAVPDERAAFTVAYEDGVYGSFAACQNAQLSGQLKVIGTEGAVTHEPAFFERDERTLTVQRGTESAEITFDTVDQMTEEFTYFADRLLTDRPVDPDGRHGLVDIRTVAAVYEAARTGQRVSVGTGGA